MTGRPRVWRATVGDALQVLRRAAWLLWRHWPVLLAIFFAGAAGRAGALWLAVEVSAGNTTVAVLILCLAPLASLTALVGMLYVLRGSLGALSLAASVHGPVDPTTHRERTLLDILASVLVPFLTVYAAYGYLREDTFAFVNAITYEQFVADIDFYTPGQTGVDPSRGTLGEGIVPLVVIGVALVVRFGLRRWEGARQRTWLGIVGAYVEVLWLATLARTIQTYEEQGRAWLVGRRAVAGAYDLWIEVSAWLGPLAAPVRTAAAWVFSLVGSVGDVIVVPVAWLVVAAVVYGHTLAPPERPAVGEVAGRVVRRLEHRPRIGRVGVRVGTRVGHAATRVRSSRFPVWRWFVDATADLRERFVPLVDGLRLLQRVGLAPMLVFCLALLLAQQAERWLSVVWREAIGAIELDTWLAFSPMVDVLNRAVSWALVVCLVAAAIAVVATRRDVSRAGQTGSGQTGAGQSRAATSSDA